MATDHPIHPKLLGGLAGTVAGGGLGATIIGILSRFHAFASQDATTKEYVAGLVVVGLATAGQSLLAYLSRWEPKTAAVAGDVIHVMDPDVTQAQIETAVNKAWSQMQAQATRVMQGWRATAPGSSSPSSGPSTATVQVTANPGPKPTPPPTPAGPPSTPVTAQDTPAHPAPTVPAQLVQDPAPEVPEQPEQPKEPEQPTEPTDEDQIPDSIPIPDEE